MWPVASRLREQGVPFVIASGGHVDPPPAEFASVPLIEKPYTVDRVTPAEFLTLVTRSSAAGAPRAVRLAQQTEGQQNYWRYGLLLMLATLVVEAFVGSR